jgi:D-xylose transport system ATP-binding protein
MNQLPLIQMENIVKEFPGVKALDGVSFTVNPGEIHSLCGENGAGKSTLMKILGGLYPFGSYTGELLIGSQKAEFKSIADSQKAGISVIFQELSLVKEMSIAENIFLGREPSTSGIIRKSELHQKASELLHQLGLSLNPAEKISHLGIGQQQMVEIAKALSHNAKVLILDEPTSALTESEVETFFKIMKALREKGVSSVLITHKLNEVMELADRITILRDGRSITTYNIAEASENKIIADMVGRKIEDIYPKREPRFGKKILELDNVTVEHPILKNRKLIDRVSLDLREGEVLGIAGLMGAGRSELLMCLFGGLSTRHTGSIFLDGEELNLKSPAEAIAKGICLVTEDRKRLGLHLNFDIAFNMTLSALGRISTLGVVSANKESVVSNQFIKDLRVKTSSAQVLVKNLSGGNQQKVVLAKCLFTKPKLVLLDEPTRGIDVGARAEIYSLINDLALQGVAVIVVSSELPEVLGMSDTVVVLSDGKLTGKFSRGEATQEKIMACATAH